jgi:hypothetical protein
MVVDRNLYWAAKGQKLILYGVPWRPKFREFTDFSEWRQTTGFDRHSLVADPLFVNMDADEFRLRPESPAHSLPAGLTDSPG